MSSFISKKKKLSGRVSTALSPISLFSLLSISFSIIYFSLYILCMLLILFYFCAGEAGWAEENPNTSIITQTCGVVRTKYQPTKDGPI